MNLDTKHQHPHHADLSSRPLHEPRQGKEKLSRVPTSLNRKSPRGIDDKYCNLSATSRRVQRHLRHPNKETTLAGWPVQDKNERQTLKPMYRARRTSSPGHHGLVILGETSLLAVRLTRLWCPGVSDVLYNPPLPSRTQ